MCLAPEVDNESSLKVTVIASIWLWQAMVNLSLPSVLKGGWGEGEVVAGQLAKPAPSGELPLVLTSCFTMLAEEVLTELKRRATFFQPKRGRQQSNNHSSGRGDAVSLRFLSASGSGSARALEREAAGLPRVTHVPRRRVTELMQSRAVGPVARCDVICAVLCK